MDHFEKQEAEHLPATVTDEDLANAIEDEHGAKYSPDGKRLLQGADITRSRTANSGKSTSPTA